MSREMSIRTVKAWIAIGPQKWVRTSVRGRGQHSSVA